MKTVCKKLLSLMLVAMLLVSAVPFQAFADGEEPLVGTEFTLTLDANGGTIGGANTANYTAKYQESITTLPDPVREGYTFGGWFTDETYAYQVKVGDVYRNNGDLTLIAKWTENSSVLTIKAQYYRNGTLINTNVLATPELLESQFVLEYLYSVKSSLVTVPAGYDWNGMFYNYDGTNELTQQDLAADASRTVCVKFTAKAYKIHFDTVGGTAIDDQTVYYGADYTLPSASKTGALFVEWVDQSGNVYKASKSYTYTATADTYLTACYNDEAYVLLAIHTDKTSDPVYVRMRGYKVGDEILRSAVKTAVDSAYSGYSTLYGLYTDATWAEYVAGKTPTAEEGVTVGSASPFTVHVLVSGGSLGSSSGSSGSSSSSGTTGTTDSTNPQTGDGIVLALAAMMSTGGAALILGKKKFF